MELIERRDALKVAGVAALATALSTASASQARDEPEQVAKDKTPKKSPNSKTMAKQWYFGNVYYVASGPGHSFTFGISPAPGRPFMIRRRDGDVPVRMVLMAFEKGFPVRVYGNKEYATIVQVVQEA